MTSLHEMVTYRAPADLNRYRTQQVAHPKRRRTAPGRIRTRLAPYRR